jgi:WD40 repeat protein
MAKIKVERRETFTGHKDCIYTLEAGANTDEFFSSGADGMVVQWSLNRPDLGKLLVRMEQSVYALRYLHETNCLLVAQNYEGLYLIDLNSGKLIVQTPIKHSPVFDILFDGVYVWVACGDGSVQLYDPITLQPKGVMRYTEKSARCIAYNPELKHVAVGYSDHKIRVFEANTGRLLCELSGHENSVFSLQYSLDGKKLYSAGRDARLRVWQSSDYRLHEMVNAHLYAINHLSFSPSGKYLATCSMDKSIKLWETGPLKLIKVIDKARHAGHGTSVNKVLWGDSDEVLISCSDDRTISLWSIQYPELH